jgi:hypothetical protein
MDWRIGVIRRREQALAGAPSTVGAAAGFAEAVRARLAPRTLYAAHIDMTLARPEAAQVNHFHVGQRIGLNAELIFNDRALFQGAPQAASRRQGAAFGEAQARTLFERLFSRRARFSALDERRAAPAPDIPAKRPPAMVAPPDIPAKRPPAMVAPPGRAERVLLRPSAAPVAPAPPAPAPRTAEATLAAEWGAPFPAPAQPKPVVLAAPEIRRVADQVIREIDHRISARRERMGGR